MKYNKNLLLIFFIALALSCSSNGANSAYKSNIDLTEVSMKNDDNSNSKFTGNYNRDFNDLQEQHILAATINGIAPMTSRADTTKLNTKLLRLPEELDLYKTYRLTHSIPFLVPSAAQLFIDVAQNFRDSLYSKDIPLHRIYLTSVLRTDDDMSKLRRRNTNASDNSTHRYATTFDISWKRFDPLDIDETTDNISPAKLKMVLAQVLFDLRKQNRCYVKHERKQACFHITVR